MSGAISTLRFNTEVDNRGAKDGIEELNGLIDRAYGSIQDRFKSFTLPAPKWAAGGPSGGGAPALDSGDMEALAGRMTAVMSGVGGQIRGAMGSAAGRLTEFADDFGSKFDRLGPILEKTAVRLDAAIRWPGTEKRTEGLISFIGRRFGRSGQDAGRALTDGVAAGAGRATPKVATLMDKLGAAMAARAKAAGQRLGQGVAYGLERAVHFPPNMATAFMGVRNRGRNGQFSGGMATPPPPAAPQVRAATGVNLATRAYGVLTRAVNGARWAESTSWRLIERLRDKDARDTQNLIGTWLNWRRVTGVLSSLGSVANATWGTLSRLKAPPLTINPKHSIALRGIGLAAEFAGGHLKAMGVAAASALGLFSIPFKVVGFFKDGAVAASGLAESQNKVNVLMGDSAPIVNQLADTYANRFGVIRQTTLETAAGLSGVLKNLGGMSGKGLGDTASELTKLSADMMSFSNVPMEEIGRGMRSFLAGNDVDSFRQMGISANAAEMEMEGMALGIRKGTEEMSQQEKVAIRLSILRKRSAALGINGDLERTAGSSANMFRTLVGNVTNFGAAIGSTFMPVIQSGLSAVTSPVGSVQGAFESGKGVFDTFIEDMASGFDLVAAAASHPGEAFAWLKIKATETAANVGAAFEVVGPNIVRVFEWTVANWKALLNDAFEFTKQGVAGVLTNINRAGTTIGDKIGSWWAGGEAVEEFTWTPILQGFQATAAKLPELMKPAWVDMSKDAAEAAKGITADWSKRIAARNQPPAPMNENKAGGPNEVPAEDKAKKDKGKDVNPFAGVALRGSKEDYEARIAAMHGVPRNPNARLEDLTRQVLNEARAARQDAARRDNRPAPKPKLQSI